jgi:hypothetical protein
MLICTPGFVLDTKIQYDVPKNEYLMILSLQKKTVDEEKGEEEVWKVEEKRIQMPVVDISNFPGS